MVSQAAANSQQPFARRYSGYTPVPYDHHTATWSQKVQLKRLKRPHTSTSVLYTSCGIDFASLCFSALATCRILMLQPAWLDNHACTATLGLLMMVRAYRVVMLSEKISLSRAAAVLLRRRPALAKNHTQQRWAVNACVQYAALAAYCHRRVSRPSKSMLEISMRKCIYFTS